MPMGVGSAGIFYTFFFFAKETKKKKSMVNTSTAVTNPSEGWNKI